MNIKLCKKCVHSKDSDKYQNSVCEICYLIESKGNGSNAHFIQTIKPPNCCGECIYCNKDPINIFMKNSEYCRASEKFISDDKSIILKYIRKNYLTKNRPKWCPMNDK